MPSVTDPLMGAGRLVVPLRDDTLYDEFFDSSDRARFRHVTFYWGTEILYRGPIFACLPGPALVLEGGLMAWWLGVENSGPPIDFERYPSGVSMLSNGDFELGQLYWRRAAENSKWVIGTAEVISGTRSAFVNVDFKDDDVLQSDEVFEHLLPGDLVRVQATVEHPDGGDGNVRIRAIYSGRFDHPNLNADLSFDDSSKWELGDAPDISIVNDAANAYKPATFGNNVLKVGPITKEQFLFNRGFESAFEGWDAFGSVVASTEQAHKGALSAKFYDGGLDTAALQQEISGVHEGDEFDIGLRLYSADADAPMVMRIHYTDTEAELQVATIVSERTFDSTGWKLFKGDWSPTDLDESLPVKVFIAADSIISPGGAWYADSATVKRTRGNIQSVAWRNREGTWDNVDIIPGRRYRVRAKVRSDKNVSNGEIWFRANVRRSPLGADLEEFIESQRVGPTKGKWTKFEWEFTSPSGYDRLNLHIFGQDVYGGSFWIDNVEVEFADDKEYVADMDISPQQVPSVTIRGFDHTVPEGAESVRFEVLVEDDGEGWRVDDCMLTWKADPTFFVDVVRDIIADSGLSEGQLFPAGTILFDYTIRNRTARQALDEACGTGLVQPEREWRVNADGTVDVGKAAEVFTDRTTFLLREDDVYLDRRRPDARRTMEDFAERVKVIGAERRKFGGARWVVVGEATNDDLGVTMFDGAPLNRTRFVEDGSVDSRRFAANRARMEADAVATVEESYNLVVHDWKTLGRFGVGDWIYIHAPDIGIEDEANQVAYEGGVAYPKKLRVLERSMTLGSGFRAELRRSASDVVDITEHVLWAAETSATIVVGKRRRSFVTNPQGGGASRQFDRFRKAVPGPDEG